MNTKLDSRMKLIQIVKNLNDADTQRLLAFTVEMDIEKKFDMLHSYLPGKNRKP